MSLTRNKLAVLHIARKKLDLSDTSYRSIMVQITGKTSATELDTDDFHAVMGYFEYLGFEPQKATGPDYGPRAGMASFAQLELIRALWTEYTRYEGTPDGLNTWMARTFKVSSLRFLTKGDAQKAITALKKMKARNRAA